jgi:hypothetical protein
MDHATTTGRKTSLSPQCTGAARYGLQEGHRQCPGNGPLLHAGFTAPVLPQSPCGCGCHVTGGAQ